MTPKINLGCGSRLLDPPWANCDIDPKLPGVDFVFDFGQDRWPFADGSVDEIMATHCLEHSRGLSHAMQEAWRVLMPAGKFTIVVPHPRSDFYLGDPTHVMPITEDTMMMFSRAWCMECQSRGTANTPLALRLGIDFKVIHTEWHISEWWKPKLFDEHGAAKDMNELEFVVRSFNNVIDQGVFILRRV